MLEPRLVVTRRHTRERSLTPPGGDTVFWQEEQIEVTQRPLVTAWTDRCVRECRPGYGPRDLGYRPYRRDPSLRVQYYARPLALWACLRAAVFLRDAFWRLLRSLYDRGVFHLASTEGAAFRWRDVRPGPVRK